MTKRIRIRFITFVFVVMLAATALTSLLFKTPTVRAATTYYVSTTGADANPGTELSPFRHIQKALNVSVAGDTIYVRQGKYTEHVKFKSTGSVVGGRITLSSYTGEMAIIDGTGITTGGYPLVNLNNDGAAGGYSYITIQNLRVENTTSGIGTGDAIGTGWWAGTPNTNVTVTNCQFRNTYSGGVKFLAHTNSGPRGHNNNINNCTYFHILTNNDTGECNTFFNQADGIFENNTLNHCYKIQVGMANDCTHITVRGNHFNIDSMMTVAFGIYLDASTESGWGNHNLDNITISNNMIYGARQGIGLSCEQGTSSCYLRHITIVNNIINTSTYAGVSFFKTGSISQPYFTHVQFLFNTIYCAGNYPLSMIGSTSYYPNCVIANNILMATTTHQISATTVTSTSIKLYNNDFYRVNQLPASASTNFADGSQFGTDYKKGTPGLVSLHSGSFDFHLNRTSQALNNATATYAIYKDYDFDVRPMLTKYDIGAYEYSGTTPVIVNIYPSNETVSPGIPRLPTTHVNVTDTHGNDVTIFWYENSTGTWQMRQRYDNVDSNHTYTWTFSQASAYDTRYFWKVAANDGSTNVSVIYWFETESYYGSETTITTIVVQHNLSYTPNFVTISFTTLPTDSYVSYYVDSITDVNFAVHIISETGVSVAFKWKAELI